MNKIDITICVIILLFISWVLIEKHKTDNIKPVIGDNSPGIGVKAIGDCGESNGFIGVESFKSMGDCGLRVESIKKLYELVELPDKSIIGKESKMGNISGSSNVYLGLDTNKHNTK